MTSAALVDFRCCYCDGVDNGTAQNRLALDSFVSVIEFGIEIGLASSAGFASIAGTGPHLSTHYEHTIGHIESR